MTVADTKSVIRLHFPEFDISFKVYLSFMLSSRTHRLWLLLMLILIGSGINAQEKARNAVYASLSCYGPIYAIEYDRIIRLGEKLDYSLSGGLSIEKSAISFPVGLHLITGSGGHHAEFGLTVIPSIDRSHASENIDKSKTDKMLYVNPGVGYRYQRAETGLFVKLLAGPSIFLDPPAHEFLDMDPRLHAYATMSVGISF